MSELARLLVGPFGMIAFLTGMAVTLVPIIADRSRHRPGNLAPIQLISAIGAWGLLLLDEALLVSALRERSPILACASFATLLTTLGLFFRRDDGRIVNGQAPQAIEAVTHEIQQILSGAPRVGIEKVTAVLVKGAGPFIGVSVSRRGYVVVRVRQELMAWLEEQRSPAVESLLRFTFLHEIGHVLNGDHLTYRFVRSVLLAHLWWAPAAVVAAAMLSCGVPVAHTTLVTILCLALPFLAQCHLARRFLAEREEVADLRAMQTLDPSDASLLLTRSGRGTNPPTTIEKLMTVLVAGRPVTRRPRWLSKTVHWVWPEAGLIHERCESLAQERDGRRRPAQPNQWALFMGMQCGLLSVSLLACASAAFGSLPFWRPDIALNMTVMLMGLTCSMAATYCGMRVDPALVRLHDLARIPARRTVGAIFYFSFSASALLLYLLQDLSGIAVALSYPLFLLSVATAAGQVILGSLMAAARVERHPDEPGRTQRHFLLRPGPSIFISLVILICCSAAAAWCFGEGEIGSGPWNGVAIVTFAGTIAAIVASRSTSAAVRAIPPIALLDSPGGTYAIRFFWRDVYFERGITSDTIIQIVGVSTYAAIALSFACGAAFVARLMSRVATGDVVFQGLLLMSGVFAGLMALIPKRDATKADLVNLQHLQIFDDLLTAVQTARLPVANELRAALARWINHEPAIPSAVLPEPRAIWKLESLLPLVRIARAVGEEQLLARWRAAILPAMRGIVRDGAVSVDGRRPSFGYTVLAAQLVEEAGLAAAIPIEPMLDSIAEQLERWLNGRGGASAETVASACRLLDANGRSRSGAERMRMQSLMNIESLLRRPIIRAGLREIVAYVALLEDTAVRDRLASLVRARMWETLQLNPEIDVWLLLDCYLADRSLGESASPLLSLAEPAIGKAAARIADDLTTICRQP